MGTIIAEYRPGSREGGILSADYIDSRVLLLVRTDATAEDPTECVKTNEKYEPGADHPWKGTGWEVVVSGYSPLRQEGVDEAGRSTWLVEVLYSTHTSANEGWKMGLRIALQSERAMRAPVCWAKAEAGHAAGDIKTDATTGEWITEIVGPRKYFMTLPPLDLGPYAAIDADGQFVELSRADGAPRKPVGMERLAPVTTLVLARNVSVIHSGVLPALELARGTVNADVNFYGTGAAKHTLLLMGVNYDEQSGWETNQSDGGIVYPISLEFQWNGEYLIGHAERPNQLTALRYAELIDTHIDDEGYESPIYEMDTGDGEGPPHMKIQSTIYCRYPRTTNFGELLMRIDRGGRPRHPARVEGGN